MSSRRWPRWNRPITAELEFFEGRQRVSRALPHVHHGANPAEQGHFKRSLAIYDSLLREEPTDAELNAEVENVRARSRARRPHA